MLSENPTYRQIREYLERLIKKNKHNPSYMLPSENFLANSFKTSRTPVQKVLKDLQDEGIIYKIRGKGTYIKQTLTTNEQKTLYILMPHMNTRYMQGIVKGIHDYLKDKNTVVMLMLTDDDSDIEESILEYIMTQKCDGLFFYPIITPIYHGVLLKLLLNNYNVITIGNYLPKLNFSSIHCDYYMQMYSVTKYLIDNGHKNIGMIFETVKDNYVYRDRLQGHFDSITQNTDRNGVHLLEFNPRDLENADNRISVRVIEFLRDNPHLTALVIASCFAETVNRALCKVDSEEKISVIVVDEPTDTEILKRNNVMILDQMPYKIGWQAAEQLYGQICGELDSKNIVVEERIVKASDWKNNL